MMSGSHGEWITDDKVKTNITSASSEQQQQKNLYTKYIKHYYPKNNNNKALLIIEIVKGMFLFEIHVICLS